MSGIYFDDVSLKSYSALTKSGKTVIKIELETRDHYETASVLRQLDEIERERKAARAVLVPVGRRSKTTPLKALPAPMLKLPYFGDGKGEDDV